MMSPRSVRLARASSALALLSGLLLLASGAAAQENRLQSSIYGEVELKFGSYLPDVDSEFSGVGPYETMFGNSGSLLFEAEYSHYLWREVGSFAIGLSGGFTKKSGQAINVDGSISVDGTSLSIVPFRVSAIYRFDVPPRVWGIPLVPYVKLGLSMYVWWIKSENGIATWRDPATGALDVGRNMTFGWHFAAGLQFQLDALAPGMARTFDANTGVNHTYLFAEWMYADVSNFGSSSSISLGDSAWLFGIAFEF